MPWDIALAYTLAVTVGVLLLIFAIWATENRPKTTAPKQ
jgi:hypothetical protein